MGARQALDGVSAVHALLLLQYPLGMNPAPVACCAGGFLRVPRDCAVRARGRA